MAILPRSLSVAAELFFRDSEEDFPRTGEACTFYISNQNKFRILYKNIHYEIPKDCFDYENNVYKIYVESLDACSIVEQPKVKRGRPFKKVLDQRFSHSLTSCDSGTGTIKHSKDSLSKFRTSNPTHGKTNCDISSVQDGVFEEKPSQSTSPLPKEESTEVIDLTDLIDQQEPVRNSESTVVSGDSEQRRVFFLDETETCLNFENGIDLSEEFFIQNLGLNRYMTSTPLNSCPSSPRSDCSFTSISNVPNKNVLITKRSLSSVAAEEQVFRHSVDSSSSGFSSFPSRSQQHRISMSPIPFIPSSPKRSKITHTRLPVARKSLPKPDGSVRNQRIKSPSSSRTSMTDERNPVSMRTRSNSRRMATSNMPKDLNNNNI